MAGNKYLDHDLSDASETEGDAGYDSEALEAVKGRREKERRHGIGSAGSTKRRKLSHSESSDDQDQNSSSGESYGESGSDSEAKDHRGRRVTLKASSTEVAEGTSLSDQNQSQEQRQGHDSKRRQIDATESDPDTTAASEYKKKPKRPGVVYLSSLPPYLRPSALRNLIQQRGFGPITRLFLVPLSKASSTQQHSAGSRRNTRQLYSEGWIEFASHSTARRCAETLNANPVGGKKGGWYRDDVWNMRYLRGMGWEELMAGIREERREEEGRRAEERRRVNTEAKQFLRDVERSKVLEGRRRKRKMTAVTPADDAAGGGGEGGGEKRLWRQFEVKERRRENGSSTDVDTAATDFKTVLGQIF